MNVTEMQKTGVTFLTLCINLLLHVRTGFSSTLVDSISARSSAGTGSWLPNDSRVGCVMVYLEQLAYLGPRVVVHGLAVEIFLGEASRLALVVGDMCNLVGVESVDAEAVL
jgi:hypothetical protein